MIVPVNSDGLVDLEIAEAAIDERAALLAVMQVNNEIGVVQPLDRLFVIARAAGVPTLCDAVQGFGRLSTPQADMIAISAHKIHGPKGVGALWLREGLELPPLMHGGGQEQGIRPGTLSPMLCAGAFCGLADQWIARGALSWQSQPQPTGAGCGAADLRRSGRGRLAGLCLCQRIGAAEPCAQGHWPERCGRAWIGADRFWPLHQRRGAGAGGEPAQ